jgi:ribosomal protein L7/L12
MVVRTKGGMYCLRCQRPVTAERAGHAVRNSIGALATLGLSLKSERWHCPVCGGPVEREATRKIRIPPAPVEPVADQVAVILVDPGPKLIRVLRVYRAVTGASLREAQAAMEHVPCVVGYFPPDEAETLAAELRSVGAMADVETETA